MEINLHASLRASCRVCSVLLLAIGATSCSLFEPAPAALIPTIEIAPRMPSPHGPLMVVLPGRGDDVEDLRDSGIASLIQDYIPEARILLTGDQLQYYRDGNQVERLQSQIIEPAQRAGFSEIWMVGTSLGGFGSMLYEYEHPGIVTGIVLLAPFTGDAALTDAVAAAGGPAQWDSPDEGTPRDLDSAGKAIWRLVKAWGQQPSRGQHVWLGCGADDRFIKAAHLIATQLPPDHYAEVAGSHNQKSWNLAARALFTRIQARRPK